jgi:hypothetical protein
MTHRVESLTSRVIRRTLDRADTGPIRRRDRIGTMRFHELLAEVVKSRLGRLGTRIHRDRLEETLLRRRRQRIGIISGLMIGKRPVLRLVSRNVAQVEVMMSLSTMKRIRGGSIENGMAWMSPKVSIRRTILSLQ